MRSRRGNRLTPTLPCPDPGEGDAAATRRGHWRHRKAGVAVADGHRAAGHDAERRAEGDVAQVMAVRLEAGGGDDAAPYAGIPIFHPKYRWSTVAEAKLTDA